LPIVFRVYDMLITQIACLSAILEYIKKGGDSRGSYLVSNDDGSYEIEIGDEVLRFSLDNDFKNEICETEVTVCDNVDVTHKWIPVRPIPEYESWFENTWKDYREKEIYE
ncbi:MAG TPA: hypothetical protein VK071_06065, partial [Tissierellales bacterium]|nr:hypothetical protein [Tissierellales bacterium]